MGSCRSGPAEHKRSLNWCYNINWLVVRFDLCGLWQMVGLESQNLPQNSASVVRNFLLGGSGHENIPCCHVFFTFCAPCSANDMCLLIQNTKLTKVRSKQLNLLFHLSSLIICKLICINLYELRYLSHDYYLATLPWFRKHPPSMPFHALSDNWSEFRRQTPGSCQVEYEIMTSHI